MRKVRFDHNKKVASTIPTETISEGPSRMNTMENLLHEMLPLKKADKNAKVPDKEFKPPAWKTKPKPPPHKNVDYPSTYAGKAT
jgi:hypothetical protein